MANFEAKEFSFSEIHGGQRYQNGEILDAEAINKPIEASYYAQETAKDAKTAASSALDRVQGALGASAAFSLLDAYPIGAIYMSLSSTSPAQLFGGTWERIKQKFLFAADSGSGYLAGSEGGEIAVTIDISQMPKHNHGIRLWNYYDKSGGTVSYSKPSSTIDNADGGGFSERPDLAITEKGEGKAHNNMPPYLAVYMWKRIS